MTTFATDLRLMCCPRADHGDLRLIGDDAMVCSSCGHQFLIVNGRPILFDEARTIFSADTIASKGDARQFQEKTGWRYRMRKCLPAAASRDVSLALLEKHKDLLPANPVILVVGCGFDAGRYVVAFPTGRVILTDVTLQGDAFVACDGACLPFRDQTFDCVIVDQVLEHALDPNAVVGEVYRCLKFGGLVYSGVPFHAPVHGFPFDFQRYTPLGHRLLFRRLREIEFCITQGPASAMSLTMIGFCAGMSKNVWWRRVSSGAIRLLIQPLLAIDRTFRQAKDLTIPAASGFLGRKEPDAPVPLNLVSQWIQEWPRERASTA